MTIVTTVTTATILFAPISPAVNGFYWVNGFLFVRPTFPPTAVHPITEAAPPPFWENFLRDPTHSAGRSSFYILLLFVRVFAGLVYGGQIAPPVLFSLWLPNPNIHLLVVLPAPGYFSRPHACLLVIRGLHSTCRRRAWLLSSTTVAKKTPAGKLEKYGQTKFTRNTATTHGADVALVRGRPSGVKGRKITDITLAAGASHYDYFINGQTSTAHTRRIKTHHRLIHFPSKHSDCLAKKLCGARLLTKINFRRIVGL